MKIIRVFPRRTSMTPDDPLAFVGDPPLFRPDADEVHVSCCFTWDIGEARRLQKAWARHFNVVKLGGPAIEDKANEFTPGMYLKKGITITSRGCPNRCDFCLVPQREGNLRELEIKPGHIIQDNNITACHLSHFKAVCEMLQEQPKAAEFKGGLEAGRFTAVHVAHLLRLRIHEVWFAYDQSGTWEHLQSAAKLLEWLPQRKKRCYVLCGRGFDTIKAAEGRLRAVFELGFYPFAMLFQPADGMIDYSREWKAFQRTWTRPAAFKALMKEAT